MRRRWAGLRQKDLARICNVSVNTLSAIERDAPGVKIETLNRVLSPFGSEVGIRRKPPDPPPWAP
ncbi:helix-turn-helix domain-containing protein [Aquisalimonas lutea]|uniref:helix-turn-helix domain-containing protein n=1 Tax=Aquisalimonas lutea TaxID=1327750 RepID=UPI00338EBD75